MKRQNPSISKCHKQILFPIKCAENLLPHRENITKRATENGLSNMAMKNGQIASQVGGWIIDLPLFLFYFSILKVMEGDTNVSFYQLILVTMHWIWCQQQVVHQMTYKSDFGPPNRNLFVSGNLKKLPCNSNMVLNISCVLFSNQTPFSFQKSQIQYLISVMLLILFSTLE